MEPEALNPNHESFRGRHRHLQAVAGWKTSASAAALEKLEYVFGLMV